MGQVCDVYILAIATLYSLKKYYLDISFTNFIMNIFALVLHYRTICRTFIPLLLPFSCEFFFSSVDNNFSPFLNNTIKLF